ncbi:hypothetical protein EBU94_06975, partial [bacterium]|nr:hypothetical protein [bacterium]
WFYHFHKSIRQTDFFEIQLIHRKKNILTGKIEQEDIGGGLFDQILYSTIHLDSSLILKNIMERLFREFTFPVRNTQ